MAYDQQVEGRTMNDKTLEAQAALYALHLAAQAQGSSNAAGCHGGTRKEQLKRRRREGKKEAKGDY
jgi:hypothetical protein